MCLLQLTRTLHAPLPLRRMNVVLDPTAAEHGAMDLGDEYGVDGTSGADPDDALYDSLEWEQQCWLVINA